MNSTHAVARSSHPPSTPLQGGDNLGMNDSTSGESFPCLACEMMFQTADDRDQHRMNEHPSLYAVGECLFCGSRSQKYPNAFAFRDHFKQIHRHQYDRLMTHTRSNRLSEIEIVSTGYIKNDEDRMNLAMTRIRATTAQLSSEQNPMDQNNAIEGNAASNDDQDAHLSTSSAQTKSRSNKGKVAAEQVLASLKLEPSSEVETKGDDDPFPFAALSPIRQSLEPGNVGDTMPIDTGAIRIFKKKSHLAILLARIEGEYELETVDVEMTFSLVNHKDEEQNKIIETEATFNNKKDCLGWGIENVIPWKTLMNTKNGFIKDEKITVCIDFCLSNVNGFKRFSLLPTVELSSASATLS